MKKILTLVIVFSAAFLACGFSGDAKREEAVRSLYGRIFVTDNYAAADYRVCVVKNLAQADLRVYAGTNARSVGRWEFVTALASADFLVYYTSLADADITVYFVSDAAFAGPSPRYR